jgi:Na+/H+-translocating membrane pyrophosphatase
MSKILMKIMQDIDESKNPGLWDNIRAQRERGETPSRKGSKAYKTAVAAGKRINKKK